MYLLLSLLQAGSHPSAVGAKASASATRLAGLSNKALGWGLGLGLRNQPLGVEAYGWSYIGTAFTADLLRYL